MSNPNDPSPRREVTPEIRNRFLAGGVMMSLSIIAIVGVVVAGTMSRMPVYGWWPLAIGAVVAGVGVAWSCWHYLDRLYFATFGVECTAVVVAVHKVHNSRTIAIEYVHEGHVVRTTHDDQLRAFSEGMTIAILVDPRHPSTWVRREMILHDTPRP